MLLIFHSWISEFSFTSFPVGITSITVLSSYPVPPLIIVIAVITPSTVVAVSSASLPFPTTLTVGGVVYSDPPSAI